MYNLNKITVDSKNNNFKTEEDKLLSKDGKILHFIYGDMTSTNITIPKGVEEIKSSALSIMKNTENIKLPASISNITSYTFDGLDNLQMIEVDENNEKYKTIGNGVYSKNGEDLIIYVGNENKIEIPESVKNIKGGAIRNSIATEIILPTNLETIEDLSFRTLKNVSIINIPAKVKRIDVRAFGGINAKIKISEQNQTYKSVNDNMILSKDGKRLYWVNRNVENIEIPSTVEIIVTASIASCYELKEVKIPNGVKTIGNEAFSGCAKLSKIVIPSSVEMIYSNAFQNDKLLKEIIIEKPENSISGAPWGCPFGNRAIKWKE